MSNSRPSATLNIDLADIPIIVHALAIARNTALMCGTKRHKDRVEALRLQLVAMTPPVALKFDEYKFCDIIARVDRGEEFQVICQREHAWSDYNVEVVFTDTVKYKCEGWKQTKEEAEQVAKEMQELLDQIKPL